MYLKRLEIFGFKSFADRTVLNFEKGITAVVGPNGCGKSNIFDSMRWVLGEQSIKELRGSSMGDVIFNGTAQRQSLSFAEVSLTFSNEDKLFPIEYDEVTITRRLYRSGESEYLINKNTVRLKDILELITGTGIGAEAYSLVQQGKVDLIVSARPEDRRIIIDEAAGITRYKGKKREALNKLKDTENNLLRINDIILEVKRQIASLERQATKARRYKETYEKLKNCEIELARLNISDSNLRKQENDQVILRLREDVRQKKEDHLHWQRQSETESQALENLDQEIHRVKEEDLMAQNQIEMDQQQVHFNQEKIEELKLAKVRNEEKKLSLEKQAEVQKEKISALNQALEALEKTTQENLIMLQKRKEEIESITKNNKEAKESIQAHEEAILDLTSKQVHLKNDLTEVMKEFQRCVARKKRLEMELDKVVNEKEDVDNRLQSVLEDIEECSAKIDDIKSDREEKISEAAQLKSRLQSLESQIGDLEKRRITLKSQKEFIEELRVQYQDMPDPIVETSLLTCQTPTKAQSGIIGKVKEVKYLDEAKIQALQEQFPKWHQMSIHEIICETKFIELDPEQFNRMIEQLNIEIDGKSKEREALKKEIEQKENVITSMTHSIHDVEKILSSFEAKKNDILSQVEKLLGELELLQQEQRETRDSMAQLKAKEDQSSEELSHIEEDIQIRQFDIRQKRELINQKTQEKEDVAVAIAQLETELESASEQETSQKENLKIFEEAAANNSAEIEKCMEECQQCDQKTKDCEDRIQQLEKKLQETQIRRIELRNSIESRNQKREELIEKLEETRKQIAYCEGELNNISEQLHDYQMKSQEMGFDEKSIKDRLLQAYKISWDELLAQDNQSADNQQAVDQQSEEEKRSKEQLDEEIQTLKKRCDNYGSVNLVAIEEFDALKERFEFLTKQQSDLLTAKDSLQKTISKINRTTRQMFLDTFTKVSEEFRIYFRMLFGGGEAQLVLVDPENVLESGIEIVARPPGKKLQNIMLLSGGEKALSAIALIFGVFKVKPSPFCILDEIDAPLDESNVGRYGYLLKDFAKISQFIVITHNKKTIVNANVMYGITMQESGVSRIVSVKLSDNDQGQEAQEPVAVGI